MTKEQHLLIILSEECAEVTQAVSKALRFGLEDTNPTTGITNRFEIIKELSELFGVYEMLRDNGTLHTMRDEDIKKKKEKVEHFMKYSIERNQLEK